MKKTLITFLLILIGLFVVLSFLDNKGEYVFEQRIWKTNKRLLQAAKDPASVPERTFEEIANEYEKIINGFPTPELRSRAQALLAQVFFIKRDYPTARKKIHDIFEQNPHNEPLIAETYSMIGKSYELEGNWPEAQKNYEIIIHKYPKTTTGLTIPLYIANHYQEANEAVEASEAFKTAINHYQRMASRYPNSEVELKSLRLMANCYFFQKKWKEGLEVLGQILLKYPSPKRAGQIIQIINTVSVIELKDINIPVEIYQKILEQDPQYPLAKTLKKMMKGFQKLKSSNVQIKTKNEL